MDKWLKAHFHGTQTVYNSKALNGCILRSMKMSETNLKRLNDFCQRYLLWDL